MTKKVNSFFLFAVSGIYSKLPLEGKRSFSHERFLDSSQARLAIVTKLTPSVLKQLRLLMLYFAKHCYPKMLSLFLRQSRKYQISKIYQESSFLSVILSNKKNKNQRTNSCNKNHLNRCSYVYTECCCKNHT